MLNLAQGLKTPKISRITAIYERILQSPSGLTIAQLAEDLQVSTKTIQRDLYEVLRLYGIVKEGHKWKFDPQMVDMGNNNDQRMVIEILDEMAKGVGDIFYSKAHALLTQTLHRIDHPIFANTNAEKLEEKHIQNFKILERAISQKTEVTFSYNDKTFLVKPVKLALFDGFWYLLVFDSNENDEFKKFHLKSIEKLTPLKSKFELSISIEERLKNANSIWFRLSESFCVRLLIAKEMKKYFLRKPFLKQKTLGDHPDGSLEIQVEITHKMEILPIVYSYIPYIKILSPDDLAEEVKAEIQAYLEML